MSTFVLVHGGWHRGWSWKRVRERLRKAGHDVFTPTLTGLGERKHLASPSTDLNVHIEDIINVFFYEDLTDVVLVGHSFGGMTITGVANAIPELISNLVFLDAFLSAKGSCSAR